MNIPLKLNQFRNYLKNHRLSLVIVLIIVLIVLGLVFRLLTPLIIPSSPLTSSDTDLPSLNNIEYLITDTRFTGSPINIPSSLPYYQVSPVSPSEITANLIRNFNLFPHSGLQNFWISTDKTKTLSINDQSLITYAAITSQQPITPNFSADEAIATIKKQFPSFGLDPNLLELQSTKYLSGEGEESITPGTPTFFEIRFTPKLNGYPLIYGTQTEPFFIFYLNSEYFVNKAIFSPISYSVLNEDTLPTLNLDQALSNIDNGNFTLINIYSDISNPRIDPNLERINFTSVTLEYRLNQTSNTILPYFHFLGIEDSDVGRQNVEIITPAINIP